jgi:hypothetical protein
VRSPKFYYCSTWKENFWFFLGWSPFNVETNLKKTFDFDNLNLNGAGKTIEFQRDDGKRVIAIWVRNKSDIPVLAHECVHAAYFCLAQKGVRTAANNHEPLTYLTEALMKAAL